MPFGGTYRLTINSGAGNGADDLKLILPDDTTILAAAQSYIGDTIVLGPYDAGTRIQLAIISHAAPIVEGMQLYPQMTQLGIAKWDFSFENWTDLTWDDLKLELEYNSGVADHLELFSIPSEVDYGDTASILVRAVDINGGFVPLDNTYNFTIVLQDTVGYGFLMQGGTVGTTFTVQGDSGVGKWFKYAATGVVPSDTLVEIPFDLKAVNQSTLFSGRTRSSVGMPSENPTHVYTNKGSTKNGSVKRFKGPTLRTVTFITPPTQPDSIENEYLLGEGKDQLQIVDHSPHEIWPDITPEQRKGLAGYRHKRPFTIEVLDGSGHAVGDEAVRIKAEFVPMSGGHAHNNPVLLQQGTFFGQGSSGNPLDLSTDANGRAVVDSFVGSQVSGDYLISAYELADATVKDTVQLKVRVPGLSPISSGANNIITCTTTPQIHTLQNSDYGTAGTLQAVNSAVARYAQDFGMASDIFLAVVDMSLPYGGLFDISGKWHKPHGWHRAGRSVDFSKWYWDANRNTISVYIYLDGVLADSTNTIDDDKLDGVFKNLKPFGFYRWEKPDRIHYESKK